MKMMTQLRDMTAEEAAGARTDCGLVAVLLRDGSFLYYPDEHAAATSVAVPDAVAVAYVGDEESD